MAAEVVHFHVDMDAFYASVEQLDNPDYREKPVIVGGYKEARGVVSACSYEARKFGVHSAMPIAQAKRLCPNGIYVLPRMRRYQEISKQIMAILYDFTPDMQQISVDEAFMNMTGTSRIFGPPIKAALALKKAVKEKLGLNISVGIAANRYLAKMASDYDKPDGLYEIHRGSEIAFLDTLELKKIWGLGKKTLIRLEEYGISTVPALRALTKQQIKVICGESGSEFLYNAVRGIDPGILSEETKSHSISGERTFSHDIQNFEIIKRTLLSISHETMERLFDENKRSKTAAIKIRYHDFTTTTAQKTMPHWIQSAEELLKIGLMLLEKRWDHSSPIRLIGIGLYNCEDENSYNQGLLFEDDFARKKKLEQTILSIGKKRGSKMIKASLLQKKDTPANDTQENTNPHQDD